jgi:RNA polymerase sigma-70 factor (ECF subfamily)
MYKGMTNPSGIPVKDSAVINYLYTQYSFKIARYANWLLKDTELANDMTVDAFIALLTTDIVFKTELHIRWFLFITIRNKCLNYIRDHEKTVSDKHLEYTADLSGSTVLSKHEQEHAARILKIAFSQLPPLHQQIFMWLMEELSEDEIATRLKKSKKYVQNRKSEALKKLKEILQQNGYKGSLDSFLPLFFIYLAWMAIDFKHFIKN